MRPIAFVAGLITETLLNGWALSVLWAWFVVGLFDLPSLSLGNAIGLSMVISFMTRQYMESQVVTKDPVEKIAIALGWCVGRPLVTVAMGWIVHSVFF